MKLSMRILNVLLLLIGLTILMTACGPKQYSINTSITPGGSGIVSIESGTVIPENGLYDDGTELTLLAEPSPGYAFDSWSGDVTGDSNPVTVVMDNEKDVTVHFIAQYPLSTSVNPYQGGAISPEGGVYNDDTQLTLLAEPSPGYIFDCWSGDVTGDSNPVTVVMDSEKNVTANFIAQYSLSTSVTPGNAGTVTPDEGIYNDGTSLTLTATPAPGYAFDYWRGDATGDANPITVVMNRSRDITAHFIAQYSLSTSVTPGNTGTVTPGEGTYNDGTSLTLTATPAPGYSFDYWSGAVSGEANPVTVFIDSDKSVTAHFVILYSLNTSVIPVGGGSPESGMYTKGTEVTLDANAASGYIFDCWSGDVTGDENPISFIMDSDKDIIAHYKLYYSPSFSAVPNGTGNPSAAAYAGREHPVILIGSDGKEHKWSDSLPKEWLPVSEEEVQLVLCVGSEERKTIETATYHSTNPYKMYTLHRYQYHLNIQLREAKTGRIVHQTELYGSMPRAFMYIEYSTNDIYGSHVSSTQIEDWLARYV